MGSNFIPVVYSLGQQHHCRWLNGIFLFQVLAYTGWQRILYSGFGLSHHYHIIDVWFFWQLLSFAVHLTFMSFTHERNWDNQCDHTVGAPHRKGLHWELNVANVVGGLSVAWWPRCWLNCNMLQHIHRSGIIIYLSYGIYCYFVHKLQYK